jgi:hypothetical protein
MQLVLFLAVEATCKAETGQCQNSGVKWHTFWIYKGFGITLKSPFYDSFIFMIIYLFYFEIRVYG